MKIESQLYQNRICKHAWQEILGYTFWEAGLIAKVQAVKYRDNFFFTKGLTEVKPQPQ
jgi:hypothetical protein